MPSTAETVARLTGRTLTYGELSELLSDFSDEDCERLLYDWEFWARQKQKPPPGDWFCWLISAGRGFGKTRLGAEWVRASVAGASPLMAPGGAAQRIALVSQTVADGRDVGIDLERIEARDASFEEMAFGGDERALLPGEDREEWVTRFWAGKEAVAKSRGTGLEGNPRPFALRERDGERLLVEGQWVSTLVENGMVYAWTIEEP